MKARLLSASIALPIVVGFIFLGGIWFSVLMIFGASIAGYETALMLRKRSINADPIVSSISSGIVVLLAFIFSKTDITAHLFSLCVIVGGVASIIWISSVRVKNSSNILAIIGVLAVIFYVGGFLGHAPLIRENEHGLEWILLLLVVTTLTDTGAYGIGKVFGKRPFFNSETDNTITELLYSMHGKVINFQFLVELAYITAFWEHFRIFFWYQNNTQISPLNNPCVFFSMQIVNFFLHILKEYQFLHLLNHFF